MGGLQIFGARIVPSGCWIEFGKRERSSISRLISWILTKRFPSNAAHRRPFEFPGGSQTSMYRDSSETARTAGI